MKFCQKLDKELKEIQRISPEVDEFPTGSSERYPGRRTVDAICSLFSSNCARPQPLSVNFGPVSNLLLSGPASRDPLANLWEYHTQPLLSSELLTDDTCLLETLLLASSCIAALMRYTEDAFAQSALMNAAFLHECSTPNPNNKFESFIVKSKLPLCVTDLILEEVPRMLRNCSLFYMYFSSHVITNYCNQYSLHVFSHVFHIGQLSLVCM